MAKAILLPSGGKFEGYLLMASDICATDRSWVLTKEQREDLVRLYQSYIDENQETINKKALEEIC